MNDGLQRQHPLETRSLESLEWPFVIQALSVRTRSPLGGALAAAHLPFPTPAESRRLRERIIEGAGLIEASPVHGYLAGATDVSALLDRASRDGVLDPLQLSQCGQVFAAIGYVGEELRARKETAPLWSGDFSLSPRTPPVCERITRSVSSDGAILDSASPELARLRAERAQKRAAFEQTLETRVKEWSAAGILQDSFYDQVDGRYVVPVKTGEQSSLDGTLVGRSNTGQSVFIEPAELRVANNALKELDLAIRSEEFRILRALSREVGQAAPAFAPWITVLAELDLALAAARLAKDWQLCAPDARAADDMLALGDVFHPGLKQRAADIVTNTFELPRGGSAMLISGPNTGGKTVLLKAAALAACMARAGLPVAARKGSAVPHYARVIALIGDEQNIAAGLSSFSAQIKDLAEALAEGQGRSLVVVDEILSSTDPEEASALAQAVIEELVTAGHHVIVTSHFSELSLRCKADPRLTVAAMEFEGGRPTYRLRPGELGTSHALEVAGKLGFPAHILARARALMSTARLDYERAAAELKQKELDLSLEHARAVSAVERELDRYKKELRKELEGFMARAQSSLGDTVKSLTDRLSVYTRQGGGGAPASGAPGAKTAARLEASARDGLAALAEGARKVQELLGAAPAKTETLPLTVGALVKIRSMKGARATVLDLKGEGAARTAVLQSGNFRMEKPADDLEVLPPARERHAARSNYVGVDLDSAPVERKLDVRGKRFDDALAECERYLDRAFRGGASQVTIVTGHGTGALKKGLRDLLAGLTYVKTFRPEREGDDGATLIEFDL